MIPSAAGYSRVFVQFRGIFAATADMNDVPEGSRASPYGKISDGRKEFRE
jgi:hypothetical protein